MEAYLMEAIELKQQPVSRLACGESQSSRTSSGVTTPPIRVRPLRCFPGPRRIAFKPLSLDSTLSKRQTEQVIRTYPIFLIKFTLGRLPSSSRA